MGIKFKIAGIGELLWDMLPGGKEIGGAPFNFAYHAHQLGCDSCIFSAVGDDDSGGELMEKVNSMGVKSQLIQLNSKPTSSVSVELDSGGNPKYIIHENVAWDNIAWEDDIGRFSRTLDAVCFGSLAQRSSISAKTIGTFLDAVRQECLKIFDINLRQNYYSREVLRDSLDRADVLKLNETELEVLSTLFRLRGSLDSKLRRLLTQHKLNCIAYTMGEQGSILLTEQDSSYIVAPQVKVVDTVGAGDSFTSVLTIGLLLKRPLSVIHSVATELAAFICTQKGATPELPAELSRRIYDD
jgi:fructokinase